MLWQRYSRGFTLLMLVGLLVGQPVPGDSSPNPAAP